MTALLLSALLFQTPPAGGDWTAVTSLPSGTAIRVDIDAGSIEGKFVSATDDSMIVTVGGRDTTLRRERIKIVRKGTGKSQRGRNTLIGFGAGAMAGLLVQKATCKGNNCMAEAAFVYTVPLELVGAVAGALAPSRSWTTVYRR